MRTHLTGLAAGLALLTAACAAPPPERALAVEVNRIYRDSDGEALLELLCPDAREQLLARLRTREQALLAFAQATAGENPTVVYGRALEGDRVELTVRKPGRPTESLEVRVTGGQACLAPLGPATPPLPTPIPQPTAVAPTS